MSKLLFLLCFSLLLAACGAASTQEADSGVKGHVTIGPTCPVERIDAPCPDKPYQATLAVLNAQGKKIIEIQTDTNGDFQLPLEPGEYILQPKSLNVMPHAPEQAFTVVEGKYTTVDVTYDSGIR